MRAISQEKLSFVAAVDFSNQNPYGSAQLFGAITVEGSDTPVLVLLAPSNWNAGELRKIADRMIAVGSP
jgi:hypothetical protein